MRQTNLWALLLLIGVIFTFVGCQNGNREAAPDSVESRDISESESETREESEPKETVIYRLQNERVTYLSNEKKEAWREPLIAILSKMHPGGYYEEVDPEAEDPDMRYEYIPGGYAIALMDFNADGVPEVVEAYSGGSAGNTYYEIFDLYSGEPIGSLNGGGVDEWCVYYHTSYGSYETVGQYEWRIGWAGRTRFITKATVGERLDGDGKAILEREYLCVEYSIDMMEVELTPEQIEAGVHASYEEIYPATEYFVNGDRSYFDEYYTEYDAFVKSCIRLPETAMTRFTWDSVSDEEEAQSIRALKMAEALLTSNQMFIEP